jgi:hypothetical protein
MKLDKVPCRSCEALTLPATLEKTDGICRKCFNKKKTSLLSSQKNHYYLKLVSWYQVLTAILSPLFLFLENGFSTLNTTSLLILWLGIVFINFLAGFLLLQKRLLGIYLSILNLLSQSFYVVNNSLNYEYHGFASFFIFLNQNYIVGVTSEFNPVLRVFLVEKASLIEFGINPLSIFFIFIIYKSIKADRRKKNKDKSGEFCVK